MVPQEPPAMVCSRWLRVLLATCCCAAGFGSDWKRFQGHLRCPFAHIWIEHGAEAASKMLGIQPHMPVPRRQLSTQMSCVYNNPFSGPTCFEFRGTSWTAESAKARCDSPPMGGPGTFSADAGCSVDGMDGWCMTEGGAEATPMAASAKSWCQGQWVAMDSSPSPESGDQANNASGQHQPQSQESWGSSGSDGNASAPTCLLAPGAMGAAHQMASSSGYSMNCPGAPGQQSSYMWPLKWTAHDETRTMPFGSDEIQYMSTGRSFYRLDKNWKRSDTFFQMGILRAIGQVPCEEGSREENGTSEFGCDRNAARHKNSTVLHRNNKMVFIDWVAEQDGEIASCSWTDLGVIGNVRPDWFLDNRGDATGVQYLGNQHIYYLGQPKLVKQWRKKDFANQYFTMSMQANPGADGVHWPLQLNIPGEGFGDDQLKHYYNHRVLGDDELDLFLLDEKFVAAGGSCPKRGGSDGGVQGPPTGQVEHVPSNLEKEDVSWREIVWTGSPVWVPPAETEDQGAASSVQTLTADISVETCFDSDTSELRVALMATIGQDQDTPWAAVGFLETDECLMTPRGGGDGKAVYAEPSDSGYRTTFANVPASLRSGSEEEAFLSALTPIADMAGYDGSTEHADGKLTLRFARKYEQKPTGNLHFNYAVGYQSKGYHKSRGCFTVESLSPCSAICSAAAAAAQPHCTPSNNLGQLGATVSLSLVVQNVDYMKLIANETLRQMFEEVVASKIAEVAGVGISAADVAVALSQGSVKVDANIIPPLGSGITAASLESKLSAARPTLAQTVAAGVQALPGIDTIASGSVTVVSINISATPSTSGDPELTAGASPVNAVRFCTLSVLLAAIAVSCM